MAFHKSFNIKMMLIKKMKQKSYDDNWETLKIEKEY